MTMNEGFDELRKFADFIKEYVDNANRKGEIQKAEIDQQYFGWKVDKFGYSMDRGVFYSSAVGEYTTKKHIFLDHNIEDGIQQTEDFLNFLASLQNIFKIDGFKYKLDALMRKLVDAYISKSKNVDALLEIFLKELSGEPIKIGAVIELHGLTVEPESVQLVHGLKLRRPNIGDLENQIPILGYDFRREFLHPPNSILELEMLGNSGIQIQRQIEKSIILFRLFKVCGVKHSTYKMFSEGIANFIGGTVGQNQLDFPSEIRPIFISEIDKLKKFWKEMSESLPEDFIAFGKPQRNSNLTFAYQRYSDALSSDALIERKITNAIMGLEALFLNTSQELNRYLGLRVSKFLSLAGYDAYEVRNILKDAYRIRSIFVHGNPIDYIQKKRFESKHGSINNVLLKVLEYLRVSIVLLINMKKEKDEIIDLIDDVFIDRKKEDALAEQLKNLKVKLGID